MKILSGSRIRELELAAIRLRELESAVLVVYTTEIDNGNPDPSSLQDTSVRHTQIISRTTFEQLYDSALVARPNSFRMFSIDNEMLGLYELAGGKFLDIAVVVP